MLFDYFSKYTGQTVTGGHIGCEIETDFLDSETGEPISRLVNDAILNNKGTPDGCVIMRELGVQKIELAVGPCGNFDELLNKARESLEWLYKTAADHGAEPVFAPELEYPGDLLYAIEPRDKLWVQLDGEQALEELCRASSMQFTVDVNPADAVAIINELWGLGIHEVDYAPNDLRMRKYIKESRAGYRSDRYAGPDHFENLKDYADKLALHDVVMHHGKAVRLNPLAVADLDTNLFIRSVWWHYRLRTYGQSLAVEIRPFSRRGDDRLETIWKTLLAPVFGL